MLLLYVDDIIVFGQKPKYAQKVINLLSQKFYVKVLGKTKKLLRVDFEESDSELYIHESDYISKVCAEYEKYTFPITSLPIPVGVIYSKKQCPKRESEVQEMSRIPYRNLIGSLAFLANGTQPDICYALNIFSQFQENLGKSHWEGLLKVLGYVTHMKNFKLNLSKIRDLKLAAY